MRWRWATRIFLVLAVLAWPVFSGPQPVWAGALSGTSLATSNNSRYDVAFTSATTSSLTGFTMTLPAGTQAANAYLDLDGTANNYASTPDSAAVSVTGDIDLRSRVALDDWTPTAPQVVIAKAGAFYSFQFFVNNSGSLVLMTSANGSTWVSATSTVVPTVTDGQELWVRVTRDVDNGVGGNTTAFYTSTDGQVWTQLGVNVVVAGTTSIYNSADPLEIGSDFIGCCNNLRGRIYYADLRSGIGGSAVAVFDPSLATAPSPSWVATTGETWTVNRSGSSDPADIGVNLSVVSSKGLPAGGVVSARLIDSLVTYAFSSAPIVQGTDVVIAFSGFRTTPSSGTHSSTFTTLNGSTAIDTGTSGNLVYDTQYAGVTVDFVVDPVLIMTVAGHNSGSCNGVAVTSSSSTSTVVALGRVTVGASAVAAQDVTVTTNAGNGYSVFLRSPDQLSNGSWSVAAVPGNNASPQSFPSSGTEAFGYSTDDVLSSYGSGSARFQTDKWAAVSVSDEEVAFETSSVSSATTCVAFRLGVAASTPAGSYSQTIVYTAIPHF